MNGKRIVERKKEGRRGKGEEEIRGGQKKGGEKRNASRGKKEGKKRKRVIAKKRLLGIEPMPGLKV